MSSLIQVQNFRKNFGTKQVHKDVSFEVFEGECLGLIGGSGSGKSVLLRSLIGLEKPNSGKVLVFGQDITQFSEAQLIEIRKKVAYVFQNGALFDSMSVFDNLAYPLREHFDLSEEVIREKILFQLSEFGLEGNENMQTGNLSGGMQKRVGLARSMMMDPQVVLYDEPTAGLDPFNTKRIQDLILEMKRKGKTSILVTHDMPTASRVCDRMVVIEKGKISEDQNAVHKFAEGDV